MLDCVRSLSPAPGVSYSRLKSLAQESAVHPDSSISLTSPPAYFLTPEKMHEMRGRGISLKIPISTEQKLERTPDPEPVKVQGFRWGCWGGFGLHWASVAMLPLGTAAGHALRVRVEDELQGSSCLHSRLQQDSTAVGRRPPSR